jgi:Lar family restriction alleviation protein
MRPELSRLGIFLVVCGDSIRHLHHSKYSYGTRIFDMTDDELLPCPFCGGEAERFDLEDGDNFGGSVIQCKKCQCSTAVHFDRKEHLYSSWNERTASKGPTEAEILEQIMKAVCEHEFPRKTWGVDVGPALLADLRSLALKIRAAMTDGGK